LIVGGLAEVPGAIFEHHFQKIALLVVPDRQAANAVPTENSIWLVKLLHDGILPSLPNVTVTCLGADDGSMRQTNRGSHAVADGGLAAAAFHVPAT